MKGRFIQLPSGELVDKGVVGEIERDGIEYYELPGGTLVEKSRCSVIERL